MLIQQFINDTCSLYYYTAKNTEKVYEAVRSGCGNCYIAVVIFVIENFEEYHL